MNRLPLTILVQGTITAPVARLAAPLSLWGGFEIETGLIIDVTHPNAGRSLAGRVVMMTEARGSSSSSSTLLEAARAGTAPAAIIMTRADPILAIGSLVAAELYGAAIPIALLDANHWHRVDDGCLVEIDGVGSTLRLIEGSG